MSAILFHWSPIISENLVLDQLIIPWLIYFFIPITCLLDIVLILWGEILNWSLMGFKGLMWRIKISCWSQWLKDKYPSLIFCYLIHDPPSLYKGHENLWSQDQLSKGWTTLSNGYIAIQQIGDSKTYCIIRQIEIYPVNSVIQSLNNQSLFVKSVVFIHPLPSSLLILNKSRKTFKAITVKSYLKPPKKRCPILVYYTLHLF